MTIVTASLYLCAVALSLTALLGLGSLVWGRLRAVRLNGASR